jgi:RimJ/RimL family protein N-acetyltransferase
MRSRAPAIFHRARRVGFRVLTDKLRIRCWSTRASIIVSSDTKPREMVTSKLPLSFSVAACPDLDVQEFALSSLRGADLLFAEGLLRFYRQCPGDIIVARTSTGALAAVGLLSYSDRHQMLDAAAPGLYPRLPSNECWTEAFYVMPEYRNRGVMAATLAAVRALLNKKGIHRMHAIIGSTNARSLRAFARAGYEPAGTMRLDRFRLNRFSTRFIILDDKIRERWRQATLGAHPRTAVTGGTGFEKSRDTFVACSFSIDNKICRSTLMSSSLQHEMRERRSPFS